MEIVPGMHLGRYEVRSKIGEGGMGKVYRARDEKLNRDVAIKVLPAALSQDADRLRRLEQEAQAAGALNHPNILAVHDVGTHDGAPYVVSELLEGESLRERLERGPLAQRKATDYAIQIAHGLSAAHEKAIVHRDLKPDNLFITKDERVKILDFGLAKLIERFDPNVPQTEIETRKVQTNPGTVMGTVGYMSPEQVLGKHVDHRSDIFSFGAVLYEMLSGRRAFRGDSAVETLNAILKEEARELSETNAKINPGLERIVQHCLEKGRERRFQSASDVAFALESFSDLSGSSSAAATASVPLSRTRNRERLVWITVTAVLLLAAVGSLFVAYFRKPSADTRVFKLSLALPGHTSSGSLAVSPDGHWLAFAAATGGKNQLWIRELDALAAQALPGTEGAEYPFWSPDSRFLGFFAGGKLKKIASSGGAVQMICDVGTGQGGTWNRDGEIIFSAVAFGLFRVSATGGEVMQMRALDRARQESVYHSPFFLPDGRHFLYYIQSGRKDVRGIYVGSLDDDVKQRLLDADQNGVYAPPGYLVFVRQGTLLTQAFDARALRLSGEAIPLAESVGSNPNFTRGNFSVSDNGLLVYDSSLNRQSKQLVWVDRGGKPLGSQEAAGSYTIVWLSPDEKRVAIDRFDGQTGTYDLWIQKFEGDGASRFTFDPADDVYPVWSPDGSRIVWASNREGVHDLYQKAASGAGQDELLLKSDYRKFPTDWSQDGRFIVYYEIDPKTKRDIWILPADRSQKPFPFLQTEANEAGAQLSPDGRWIAYASDESGSYEVYVRSFPDARARWQISTKGGVGPHWRRDGKELFYYSADGKVMSAEVGGGTSFAAGAPVALFEFRSGNGVPFIAPFTVAADGQRFLLNTLVDESGGAPLTIMLNWTANLKR
jgi:serine/threonine protein kinase